jgi:outer membrane protein assembly factor BamB
MARRVYLLLALAVGLAGSAVAGDWPQWLGPNRDGKSTDKGLLKEWPKSGPKLLWSLDKLAAVGTGYGSPAVVGDKLYILGGTSAKKDAKEFCTCLNVRDGSRVWQTRLETSAGSFLDMWGGGPRSTPTVDGDHVYVLGETGNLHCLNRADGKLVWQKNLVTDFGGKLPTWGYAESPLVDGDKVLCTPGGHKNPIVALNKKTGAVIWKCGELPYDSSYASLVIAEIGGVRQYVQNLMKDSKNKQKGGATVGVAAIDGKVLWKVDDPKFATAVIPTPVVAGNKIFITAGYGFGCALIQVTPTGSGFKAETVFRNGVMENHHGGVIQMGEYVYGHSKRGWECVSLKDGELAWPRPVTKLAKGSITYADGYFYCYGESKGTLARIKVSPEDWIEAGRFTIPKLSKVRPNQGHVWAHPVIANGKLYLRDYEMFYCYDLGQPGA